jgi:magnesium chelatase subunit ChlI-like protein
MTHPNLSARAYHRILKLARTIADLRAAGRGATIQTKVDVELTIHTSTSNLWRPPVMSRRVLRKDSRQADSTG